MTTKQTIQKAKKAANQTNGIGAFIEDTKLEIRKVSWPNKEMVVRSSVIIIIMMVFFTAYVTGLDLIFSKVLRELKGI